MHAWLQNRNGISCVLSIFFDVMLRTIHSFDYIQSFSDLEFLPYEETKIWVSFETLWGDKWPTLNVLWKRTSFSNFWSRNCKLSLQPMTFNSFSFILQPITHNFFCLVWKVKVVIICWFLHFFALKASWTFIPLYTCVSQFNLQFLFPCYTR